jgi:hypothetical protein
MRPCVATQRRPVSATSAHTIWSPTERFATPLSDDSLGEIFYNGRYVVVGLLGSMVAIDPASGRIAWSVGS